MEPKGRRPTEYKEGDRKKILCEETRGKSQEVAVGKLTPPHTHTHTHTHTHNYIFFTASQQLKVKATKRTSH